MFFRKSYNKDLKSSEPGDPKSCRIGHVPKWQPSFLSYRTVSEISFYFFLLFYVLTFPRVIISHIKTPNAQTSDIVVNSSYNSASGGIHRNGKWRYVKKWIPLMIFSKNLIIRVNIIDIIFAIIIFDMSCKPKIGNFYRQLFIKKAISGSKISMNNVSWAQIFLKIRLFILKFVFLRLFQILTFL